MKGFNSFSIGRMKRGCARATFILINFINVALKHVALTSYQRVNRKLSKNILIRPLKIKSDKEKKKKHV